MIGLGLDNEKDISLKGLEAIKNCDHVYLEAYTSKLNVGIGKLKELYDKNIIIADRNLVENNSDEILMKAKDKNVAFLVIGDIFGATTHSDLFLRATELNVKVELIHNTSIINAVGVTGLQLYKFGKTTSLIYPEENYSPETAYDVIKMNKENGLHTLVLLDIKMDKDKFMTIAEALELLLKIESKRNEKVIDVNTKLVGCARISASDQRIFWGVPSDLLKFNFGVPLHCIIVPGKLHFMEEDMLNYWTKISIEDEA